MDIQAKTIEQDLSPECRRVIDAFRKNPCNCLFQSDVQTLIAEIERLQYEQRGFADDLNLQRMEDRMVRACFDRMKGKREAMASALGIPVRTLYAKLKNIGIKPRQKPGTCGSVPIIPQNPSVDPSLN